MMCKFFQLVALASFINAMPTGNPTGKDDENNNNAGQKLPNPFASAQAANPFAAAAASTLKRTGEDLGLSDGDEPLAKRPAHASPFSRHSALSNPFASAAALPNPFAKSPFASRSALAPPLASSTLRVPSTETRDESIPLLQSTAALMPSTPSLEIHPSRMLDRTIKVPKLLYTLPDPMPKAGAHQRIALADPAKMLLLFDLDETLFTSLDNSGTPDAVPVNIPGSHPVYVV
jgi:hypothetical protein